VLYSGPLVVLTSRFSASASEIVAAALQDYGRAIVVGDSSTHGKGTVQAPSLLKTFMRPSAAVTNDPGLLKYTVSKFYRANGESTQLKGVVPDIVLPSVINHSTDIGESSLDNPLPWDTIDSAKFDRINMVEPYKTVLADRSRTRIAASKDFDYVAEDIQQFEKMQKDKSISLNEAQRLKEKEEAEARQKAREKERLARQEADLKLYELTLKDVDNPGLPAPVAKTNTLAKASSKPSAAAASTNSASAAPAPAADPDTGDEVVEDTAPPTDFVLDESQNILVDYLGLLSKEKALAAGKTTSNAVQ
jgi:carboxyl-terminal processing protease